MVVTVGFYNYGLVDWSAASHKAIIARNKGIWMNEKHRIKAPKLLLPYFFFIPLAGFYPFMKCRRKWLCYKTDRNYKTTGFHTLIRIFSVVPIILLDFVEFISMGKHKAIYGKAPYLFTLGENI
jgi:hypothetical protein